jgi:hypothetical protein
MHQTHAKALEVQVQSRADSNLRPAQDEDVLSNLSNSLPERTKETSPDKGGSKKILRSVNDLFIGKMLHRKVIVEVDHFENGPIQPMFIKEMNPGAVSLVIAGDALELKGATGTRGKDHAVEPMFLHGSRDPVRTAWMTGGKDHFAMGHFRPFFRQFQNLGQCR